MTMTRSRSETRSPRRAALAGALVIAAALVGVLVVRYRHHARLSAVLRAQAGAAGVVLKFGAVQVRPWQATLRVVEVEFPSAPGVKAVADTAILRSGSGSAGLPEIAVEHLTVNVSAGALVPLEELSRLALWRELPLTWRHLTVRYENRLMGPVVFDDVRLERPAAGPASPPSSVSPGPLLVVRAGRVGLAARRWENVVLALQRRGEMLEVGIGSATVAGAPFVLGIFPSPPQAPAAAFIASIAHPPAATLAGALGVRLGPAFDGVRVGGSLSFTIFDDPSRAISGNLELILTGWPSPSQADAAVILGKNVGFGARLVPAADRSTVALEGARVSTALFSLFGVGRLVLTPELRLTLDLSGSLTCAQIGGNLPPSDVRTAVSKYLAASAARASEHATMRIQLDVALAKTDEAQLGWKLEAACGLPGFSVGRL